MIEIDSRSASIDLGIRNSKRKQRKAMTIYGSESSAGPLEPVEKVAAPRLATDGLEDEVTKEPSQ
jgi:hypothetical protein